MTDERFDPDAEAVRLAAAVRSPSRLAAVVRSGLLDSPTEEAFDALTRMAVALLRVPASYVTIVDGHRDFFKSEVGFPEPLKTIRQLDGVTFCHHTVDRQATLAITDTHADPVWRAVPSVGAFGVRAYLGVPLQLDGETIGSFCVMDREPREWSADEVGLLEQIALSAERELTLRVALQDARDEVVQSQSMIRAKEEIVAVVAHDLRTPLQILHLGAIALQGTATGEQSAIAVRMLAATQAMRRMADELLAEHAPNQVAGARRRSITAAAFLGEVADTMSIIAGRAAITIAVEQADEAELSVDYAQMLRVFCNLVGNAIKFSPQGSRVALAALRDDAMVRLSVTDRGCGMSERAQQHVFERGWQGAEGLSSGDGAGLGLPIVQTLVERNGGTVYLRSAAGRGTTVTVTMPCR